MDIKTIASKYSDYIIEKRRYFHAHPEVSEKEFETSRLIGEELTKMGVEWRKCGKGNSILATIRGEKPGRTILLRGDMDALSVQEETGAEYASVNPGIMHACGHDCHIAMMLTAAQILKDMKSELCGTVQLAYQHAEEVAVGAKDMIADGALDGVDACFGIHVWSDVEAGKVSVEAGPRMAAADWFVIDIKGKGSHGAAPHQGIDAVTAACGMVNSLQTLISRETDPSQPAVLTVGKINGGTRFNVVAEYVTMEGTIRCFDAQVRKDLIEGIERVINATAESYRVEASVKWIPLTLPTINDAYVSKIATAAARKVMSEDAPVLSEKTSGGEDFSYFLEKVPGAIALLGVGNEACGAVWPQHSGHYCVDESALLGGAMLYVQTALDYNAD